MLGVSIVSETAEYTTVFLLTAFAARKLPVPSFLASSGGIMNLAIDVAACANG